MGQMKKSCDIAEYKYPPSSHTVVFILDQSSCHSNYNEKVLIARNILVKDGGSRIVRVTVFAGQSQLMITATGHVKCLRTNLTEISINSSGLRADEMQTILSNNHDFFWTKTK